MVHVLFRNHGQVHVEHVGGLLVYVGREETPCAIGDGACHGLKALKNPAGTDPNTWFLECGHITWQSNCGRRYCLAVTSHKREVKKITFDTMYERSKRCFLFRILERKFIACS